MLNAFGFDLLTQIIPFELDRCFRKYEKVHSF